MGEKRAAVQTGDLVEGRYRILKLLGEGGMGAVFLAEHTLIKRRVAIKILHPRLATDAHVVDCFMNEARAAGTLGHPNIVESTDMGFTQDHVPYIVFEYLEGALLTDEIYRVGGLPVRRAVRIAEQIAGALRAAHDAGIVHRDLKSDNVFLTDKDDESDHVKVLDFGVSRFMKEDKQRGIVAGTPEFMAPEQLSNPDAVDARADVYALGVILYEMLGACRPFVPSRDTAELQRQILVERPPTLNRPEVPEALADLIVHKMLAKDPAARPPSMGAVIAALEGFLMRADGTPVPRRRTGPVAAIRPEDISRDSATLPRPAGMLNTPLPTVGTIQPPIAHAPVAPRSSPPYLLFGVAGLGVIVGALGLAFGLRGGHPEASLAPAPQPVAQPAPAAALPPPAPVAREPQKIDVAIDADAAHAHVVFRRRVTDAPLSSQIAASDVVELVEVSAPGYKTERYWVTMDRPTHLKAHLTKGSGLVEATEEDTLIALGEVAAPAAAPTATVAVAATSVERVAPAATRDATAPAMMPRKIGKAAADADVVASVKLEAPAAPVAPTRSSATATAIAEIEAPSVAAVAAPAPPPPPAPVIAPPPAAPAAPVASAEPPHVVSPAVFKGLRVAGGDHIEAPEVVQTAMLHDEHKQTTATVKVCVASTGEISHVSVLKSSGYAAFDERLVAGVHNWRYKAYVVGGRAVPACSAVTFVYKI
ncbi:MAG: TonB family protein [Acidobacteriota bacterium]